MDNSTSVLEELPLIPPDAEDDLHTKLVKHHKFKIGELLKNPATLAVFVNKTEHVLACLDTSSYSAAYCLILEAVIRNDVVATRTRPLLRNQLVLFLLGYEVRQVRHVGSSFTYLVEHLLHAKIIPAKETIDVAVHAILRLDPTGSVFTSLHLTLAKIAYQSHELDAILPVVDKNILFFAGDATPPKDLSDMSLPPNVVISPATGLSGKIKSGTVLEYDFVCGMIHIARGDWSKAMEAFYRVITYPCTGNGVSHIMVDGYKKWLLVGLVCHGKSFASDGKTSSSAAPSNNNLPNFVDKSAETPFNLMARPYRAFCTAFAKPTPDALRSEYTKGTTTWAEDRNQGLVDEAMRAYQKWQVVNLRKVYAKISVDDIRLLTVDAMTGEKMATTSDVGALVRNMIDSSMLAARLEMTGPSPPSTGGSNAATSQPHVVFLDDADALSESAFASRIAAAKGRIDAVNSLYTETNARLAAQREYVAYVQRDRKRAEKEGDAYRDPFESTVMDEDLMGTAVDSQA